MTAAWSRRADPRSEGALVLRCSRRGTEKTCNRRKIGGREVECGKLVRLHPAEGEVFEGAGWRAVGSEAANKGKHFDDDGWVGVLKRREGADDRGVATEFLVEFAEEGVGGRLPGLDFAAGKFPFEGEVFVRGALGDEDAAGGVFDDGAGDGEGVGWNHVRTKTRRVRELHVFSRGTADFTFTATLRWAWGC